MDVAAFAVAVQALDAALAAGRQRDKAPPPAPRPRPSRAYLLQGGAPATRQATTEDRWRPMSDQSPASQTPSWSVAAIASTGAMKSSRPQKSRAAPSRRGRATARSTTPASTAIAATNQEPKTR